MDENNNLLENQENQTEIVNDNELEDNTAVIENTLVEKYVEDTPVVENIETSSESNEVENTEVLDEPITVKEESQNENNSKKPNNKNKLFLIIGIVLLLLALVVCTFFYLNKENTNNTATKEAKKYKSDYAIKSNSLEAFDLYFLQLENKEENMIYSPLSIKYALEMLYEGAEGDSKSQIEAILGDYEVRSYKNSDNMSFANALFIRNSYKDSIKNEYVELIRNKFDGEVILDEFKNTDNINSWVSKKTFNLLNNLLSDVSDIDYVLINALAIDMEWINKIQPDNYKNEWEVKYSHENSNSYSHVSALPGIGYHSLEFENSENVKSVEIGANANKYNIVKELGESNIKETIKKEYSEWLSENPCNWSEEELEKNNVETYLENYMKEISSNYGMVSGSTDFLFYNDDNIKVFAKDLKESNGTTLQYVGVMPTKSTIKDYIKNTSSKELNRIITSLKPIELSSFKDGVITRITGYIPVFKYEYELNLLNDLKALGVNDVFDEKLANLSKITSSKSVIKEAIHKANIEFSNDGIKASAATALGGRGAAGCGYDHLWDVPVETIDLTFNRPYMYLIRDKQTGEVWFTGTVYTPTIFTTLEG